MSCGRPVAMSEDPASGAEEIEWGKKWNKEVSSFVESSSYILAFSMIIGGLFILVEFGLKIINGLPKAVYDFNLWYIIPVLFVTLIIYLMFNLITMGKKKKHSN